MAGDAHAYPSMERALRWMATRKHARPLDLITHAVNDPHSESAIQLAPLVVPAESMPDGTTWTRAQAIWGLIVHSIKNMGSADDARQQNTLFAAFRLPHPQITEAWRSTLEGRFRQLMTLTEIFGDPPPSTTTPMHKAWKRAIGELLAPILQEQLDALALNGDGWAAYADAARAAQPRTNDERLTAQTPPAAGQRYPSKGSQPVYLALFITNVIMRGRAVHRRITERLVVARADNVDGYLATSIAGLRGRETDVPVHPLWGCALATTRGTAPRPGERFHSKLLFPHPLARDEMHYFASEAIDENLEPDRE